MVDEQSITSTFFRVPFDFCVVNLELTLHVRAVVQQLDDGTFHVLGSRAGGIVLVDMAVAIHEELSEVPGDGLNAGRLLDPLVQGNGVRAIHVDLVEPNSSGLQNSERLGESLDLGIRTRFLVGELVAGEA